MGRGCGVFVLPFTGDWLRDSDATMVATDSMGVYTSLRLLLICASFVAVKCILEDVTSLKLISTNGDTTVNNTSDIRCTVNPYPRSFLIQISDSPRMCLGSSQMFYGPPSYNSPVRKALWSFTSPEQHLTRRLCFCIGLGKSFNISA